MTELNSSELNKYLLNSRQQFSISDFEETRHSLRKLMWERVGIIRCGSSFGEALKKLEEWSFMIDRTAATRREGELKNMLATSRLIVEAALLRKGSIGAHYRSDFPRRGKVGSKHIALRKSAEGVIHAFTE